MSIFNKTLIEKGADAPKEILDELTLAEIPFINFQDNMSVGQLVVHQDLLAEIQSIFKKIKDVGFPIEMMNPLGDKKRPDTTNNTSCFNFRYISGTKTLSQHSFGRAIDINPLLNPYYGRKGIAPKGATYDRSRPGTLTKNSNVVKVFESYGWEWLGRQKQHPDYMHFEKPK
ncbi:MAG TPA: M15 family metallopeptidase [Patescibacteria group bacterium]|nr:M15 family metallopeptidase [Patescibacteria group bacterium]